MEFDGAAAGGIRCVSDTAAPCQRQVGPAGGPARERGPPPRHRRRPIPFQAGANGERHSLEIAAAAHQPQSADAGGQPSKPEGDAVKTAQASESTSKSKEAALVLSPPVWISLVRRPPPIGILLRYNPDQRTWERLKGADPRGAVESALVPGSVPGNGHVGEGADRHGR